MKNDFKKIYWTIVIIWGTLASICSLLYAVFFENPSLAQLFWNLSYWSVVILLMISIVSALGFALGFIIKGFMDNPKNQMKIIVAFIAMIVLLVSTYFLSSGTDVPVELFEKTGSDYGNSKLIGGNLYTVYVLMVGVIIAAIYSEIAKKLK